jgi:A/G-specific adenine glycosylase
VQLNLAQALLEWYSRHARQLPWRTRPDPYAVLVSEIMLQQTRVETALPYYERWLERFPDLATLAEASQAEVLKAWEGLGYYSRARNLHRAARRVMAEYGGELPPDPQELQKLPGIGPYSAAAIASIAFGADTPALDANVRRVLARLFDVSLPARSPAGEQRLRQLAAEHLPPGRAGDYNQALMDLGALVCTPRAPDCLRCPLAQACAAFRSGVQAERPVRAAKPAAPHYLVTAAVILRRSRVLIAQRPAEKLLGGLWEFPGGKVLPGEALPEGLRREIREELDVEIAVGAPLGIYRHAYTHFRVTLHAFQCALQTGEPRQREHTDLRWVAPTDLSHFAMGKIDRQIAHRLQQLTVQPAAPPAS